MMPNEAKIAYAMIATFALLNAYTLVKADPLPYDAGTDSAAAWTEGMREEAFEGDLNLVRSAMVVFAACQDENCVGSLRIWLGIDEKSATAFLEPWSTDRAKVWAAATRHKCITEFRALERELGL